MPKFLLSVICLFLVAVQCNSLPEPPDELIPEETYLDLLTELTLTRNLISSRTAIHVEDSLRQELFHHYQVSREEFELSHAWYQRQPELQLARLDTINSRLRALRSQINEGQTEWERLQREQREMKEQDEPELELEPNHTEQDEPEPAPEPNHTEQDEPEPEPNHTEQDLSELEQGEEEEAAEPEVVQTGHSFQ